MDTTQFARVLDEDIYSRIKALALQLHLPLEVLLEEAMIAYLKSVEAFDHERHNGEGKQ